MGASISQDNSLDRNQEPGNNAVLSSSADARPNQTTIINTSQNSNTDAKPIKDNAETLLPHNYEDILKHADSPVDRTSTKKLLEQLHAGISLDQKKKKYWVEKESNRNCFMLFAQDLAITWADDNRLWHWPLLKDESDELHAVAELLNVCWLEIHGRFKMANLSPGAIYEVVFVVKLKDPAYGWDFPVNLRLTLPDGSRQQHKANLMELPRGRWIEILAGEFQTSPEKIGEMEFSLYEYEGGQWKRGLLIKGIRIRPKL